MFNKTEVTGLVFELEGLAKVQKEYGDTPPPNTYYFKSLEEIDAITLQRILASGQAQAMLYCAKRLKQILAD